MSCASRAPARRSPRSTRPRSAAPPKGPVEIVRDGNFVAIVGARRDRRRGCRRGRAGHVDLGRGRSAQPVSGRGALAVAAALARSRGRRAAGRSGPRRDAARGDLYPDAPAHASVAPSCGVAVYRDGRLEVWTHSQGVYPLRAALARTLKLDPAAIVVHHAQGPGCYGHNGADDAAADAAVDRHAASPARRSGCAGGARRNSASSRSARRW